jgi:hypothetical protein
LDDGITAGCQADPPLFCPNILIPNEQMAFFPHAFGFPLLLWRTVDASLRFGRGFGPPIFLIRQPGRPDAGRLSALERFPQVLLDTP